MSLKTEIEIAISATQSGIHLTTDEPTEALGVIAEVVKEYAWDLIVWDAALGAQTEGKKLVSNGANQMDSAPNDGLTAIQAAMTMPVRMRNDEEIPLLLVVKDINLLFDQGAAYRHAVSATIQHLIQIGKTKFRFLIGLTESGGKLPPEIRPLFHVIKHELPDLAELEALTDMIQGDNSKPLTAEQRRAVARAAVGLTRLQAEGIYASSQIVKGCLSPDYIWLKKAEVLNAEGLVELHQTTTKFADVAGMHGFKDFLTRLTRYDPLEDEFPDARAKGVVAVGPPGAGKSLMAYCVGNELGIPTLKANPGNLMDQYIGNTEKNTTKFFQICRRMAPCVVVIDEVGQVMPSGKESGGGSDVSRRLLGTFLTMMQDITEPVLWFFTANDVETLHEAFLRAERVDAKVYVPLPGPEQRAAIWRMYLKTFFPKKVKNEKDPRHVVVDFDKVLEAYTVGVTGPEEAAPRFAAALMCLHGEARAAAIKQLPADVSATVQAQLIDDKGWTPAEIRACCRLSRRLHHSLFDTSRLISIFSKGTRGQATMDRLEKWAVSEGAIDAETGTLFQVAGPESSTGPKVKRKVRRNDSQDA